jgi:hypothetical protein
MMTKERRHNLWNWKRMKQRASVLPRSEKKQKAKAAAKKCWQQLPKRGQKKQAKADNEDDSIDYLNHYHCADCSNWCLLGMKTKTQGKNIGTTCFECYKKDVNHSYE